MACEPTEDMKRLGALHEDSIEWLKGHKVTLLEEAAYLLQSAANYEQSYCQYRLPADYYWLQDRWQQLLKVQRSLHSLEDSIAWHQHGAEKVANWRHVPRSPAIYDADDNVLYDDADERFGDEVEDLDVCFDAEEQWEEEVVAKLQLVEKVRAWGAGVWGACECLGCLMQIDPAVLRWCRFRATAVRCRLQVNNRML